MLRAFSRSAFKQVAIAQAQRSFTAAAILRNEPVEFDLSSVNSFEDWPKPTDAQKAKIAAVPVLNATQEAEAWAALEAICDQESEIAALNGFKSACARADLFAADTTVPQPDWKVEEGVYPEFVDSLNNAYSEIKGEVMKHEYYDPDFVSYLDWIEMENKKAEENAPIIADIQAKAEARIAELAVMKSRVDDITVPEFLEFMQPKVDYSTMEKTIHDVLAYKKKEIGHIPDWLQEQADEQLAGIAKMKSAGGLEESINERVRAGEWY